MRRVETRAGGAMLFTTLADHSGLIECVLFPDAYRRFGPRMRGEVVVVEGRVGETLGALSVTIERVLDPTATRVATHTTEPDATRVA